MKQKRSIVKICIAILLVGCIESSIFPTVSVKAQEENNISDVGETSEETSLPISNVESEADAEETTEKEKNISVVVSSETPPINESDMSVNIPSESLNENKSDASDGISSDDQPEENNSSIADEVFTETGISETEAVGGESVNLDADNSDIAESPFELKVTFAGKELDENNKNDITEVWSANSSKVMTVVINRNKNVEIDTSKQYVLCMKTSDVFYFNGLPDVSKITGAEGISIVKNSAPVVNKTGGGSGALDGFSNYSGEIRIRLNPTVETITIPDVGINYNIRLLGFNGKEQSIADPLQIQLISTESETSLDNITEDAKAVLRSAKVDTVSVKSNSLGSSNWKSAMSTDSFKTAVLMQPVTLGKDGHISYYFGTNGVEWQVYKSLTIEVNCPYIEVDGKNYYLEFDQNDTALTGNQKTSAKGYKMKENASYDAEKHTITYNFENVYLGGHTPLIYTPDYKWPSELADTTLDSDCKIQGVSFNVTEQKGYLGNDSTLQKNFRQNESYTATFISEGVNVRMSSSNESEDNVAKRFIYKDITRENGIEGTLGFFDIHNEGTKDTSLLNIEYQFNTGNSGAVYYVTKVNLAAYGGTTGTDVTYVLSNGNKKKTGKKHYPNNSSFSCSVAELREDCSADDTYYIESVSYQTYLQQGTKYHYETAHINRNRMNDSGLFFGYLEGALNTTASATMKISAVDGKTPITKDGKTEISSTETSTVSDEDYIGMQINDVNVDGGTSQLISAGSSVTLNVKGLVSTEEYPLPNTTKVNGYHVLRNGIFYICLPEGVSIAGAAQVKITSNGENVSPENPERITGAFEVDGVRAYWWAIPVKGLNTRANGTVNAAIELSTSESMAGVVWDFSRCVSIRADGQRVSWAAANTSTTLYNTVKELNASKHNAVLKLAEYFETKGESDNLGIEILNQNGNAKLNITRAEAKLDVETALSTSETSEQNKTVNISKMDTKVTYDVTIACTEQGAAEDFNYYIPIVHKDSTLDTGALVSQNDIGLHLKTAVTITAVGASSEGNVPFDIFYTTESGLNSTSIRSDGVMWSNNVTDYTNITAVRIATKENASVKEGEAYRFSVVMAYDNSQNDFDRQAGSIAAWRSFGHYTYTRNGATTTNSYPSASNFVKIQYVTDLTGNPMKPTLDTATNNSPDTAQILTTTFVREQKLIIKKVTPSNGTQLISDDPSNLTGADANSKFRISFNINNGSSAVNLPSVGAGWTIDANKEVTLQSKVFFSMALTDITTERYVDVVIGNDDVDITCRVKLERKVVAASADGSGVALGEQYQVPQVTESCNISRDSAFTALYVVKNYVPGNYAKQLLKWQKNDGTASIFPEGTMITMMVVNANSQVTDYWYCQPTGESVDLADFKRMSGNEKYRYDTSETTGTTVRYLFVVNFGQANIPVGAYKLIFDAEAKAGASVFTPVALDVTIGEAKAYMLKSTSTKNIRPIVDIGYEVTDASGNDSYSEGRSLSLVLTPDSSDKLPTDTRIVFDNKEYTCNSNGNIIIPLGTIQSGNAKLTLISKMFPDEEKTYSFSAKLYLANSSHIEAPENGKVVASDQVNFIKSEVKKPALKITGTQIASQDEWSKGQQISIEMKNLADYTVNVTAFEGISDGHKVTDLVSSVAGMFDMKDGIGTYKSDSVADGKLVLSSTAKAGTYRLVFEVKNATGEIVADVPYYFIVR